MDQKIERGFTVGTFNFRFYCAFVADEHTWLSSSLWRCNHCSLRAPSFSANIVHSERRSLLSTLTTWGPDWHRKSRRSCPLTRPAFNSWEREFHQYKHSNIWKNIQVSTSQPFSDKMEAPCCTTVYWFLFCRSIKMSSLMCLFHTIPYCSFVSHL